MGARRSGAFHDYAISVFREQGTRWRKLRPSQARGLRRFGLRRSKSEAEQRWENQGEVPICSPGGRVLHGKSNTYDVLGSRRGGPPPAAPGEFRTRNMRFTSLSFLTGLSTLGTVEI
jgi:hypothetical protein